MLLPLDLKLPLDRTLLALLPATAAAPASRPLADIPRATAPGTCEEKPPPADNAEEEEVVVHDGLLPGATAVDDNEVTAGFSSALRRVSDFQVEDGNGSGLGDRPRVVVVVVLPLLILRDGYETEEEAAPGGGGGDDDDDDDDHSRREFALSVSR